MNDTKFKNIPEDIKRCSNFQKISKEILRYHKISIAIIRGTNISFKDISTIRNI